MLTSTFQHIPGIGEKSEQSFWLEGIHTWNDFPGTLSVSAKKKTSITEHINISKKNLQDNPQYFCKLLPAHQHWRLFPQYRDSLVYLDIETTGLDDWSDHITTIALYDGITIRYYIHGDNLNEFPKDIAKYNVFVSYNGKCFDVPFLERYFNITLPQAHIDLRFILKKLGYSGGLKSCEKQLGLDRGDLDDVDGFIAVLLWREYKNTGNQKALDTLLAYNIMDVVNLETLMISAYNLHLQDTPFHASPLEQPTSNPKIPFAVDKKLINQLR